MANDYVHRLKILTGDSKAKVDEVSSALRDLNKAGSEMGESFSKGTGQSLTKLANFKKEFRTVKKDVLDMGMAYAQMSEEMKNSDIGQALKEEFEAAKKIYADMVDYQADLNQEIKNMASDTMGWDAAKEGAQLLGNAISGTASVLGYFCDNQEDAIRLMALAQGIEKGFNTVIGVGNALQKQSSLMVGIRALQQKLASKTTQLATATEVKNTAAVGANTAATVTNTAATKSATVAQKAFNLVANANPYVLLATAVAGVGTALFAWTKLTQEHTESEKQLNSTLDEMKKKQEEYINSGASSVASLITKYTILQTQYRKLNTEAAKTKWIKEHKSEMDELALSVNNVTDAENAFNKNTDAIIEGFVKRAKAAAITREMEDLYQKSIRTRLEAEQRAEKIRNSGQFKAGQKVQGDDISRYGLVNGVDYTQYTSFVGNFLTEAGAAKAIAAAAQIQLDEAAKQAKVADAQVLKLAEDLAKLGVQNGTKSTKTTKTPKEKSVQASPLEVYQKEVEIAQKRFEFTGSEIELYKQLKSATEKYNNALFDSMTMTEDIWKTSSTNLANYIAKIKEAEDAEKRREEERKRQEKLEETRVKTQGEFDKGMSSVYAPRFKSPTEGITDDMVQRNPGLDSLRDQYETLADVIKKAREEAEKGGFEIKGLKAAETQLDTMGTAISKIVTADEERQKRLEKSHQATMDSADALQSLGAAFQNIASEGPAAKAGLVLQAIGSLISSFASATAQAASTGPWGWIAFTAAGLATLTATIAQIQKFSQGGFVKGSPFGDKNLIRANGGELVLTDNQQYRLWNIIQGKGSIRSGFGDSKVEFIISGSNLRGVLRNDEKKTRSLR